MQTVNEDSPFQNDRDDDRSNALQTRLIRLPKNLKIVLVSYRDLGLMGILRDQLLIDPVRWTPRDLIAIDGKSPIHTKGRK